MAMHPNDANVALQNLSKALGLAFEDQDWGIINADPDRIDEFIRYFKHERGCTQRFELGGLILASANEALVNERPGRLRDLMSFLADWHTEFQAHFDYWRGLDDQVEFPLSGWLRVRFGP